MEKLGIIGCGNMGGALLKGIITQGYTESRNIFCFDIDRKKLNFVRLKYRVNIVDSNRQVLQKCTVIVLAVKPQALDTVLPEMITLPSSKVKLFISICAGISTKKLQRHLGRLAVVRVMPNMPAQLGQGISAMALGRYAKPKDKKLARALFSCIGEVVEVKEKLMDAVTAISGSGPAYFFYLVDRLIATAKEMGLEGEIAQRLALKTALGSAMLLAQTKQSPQALRQQVTSKGGTTAAAFKVFKNRGLDKILRQGFLAAAKRAKEMSSY